MPHPDPTPDVVNLAQLQATGTRTVEVEVNGVTLRVTERLDDDGRLDAELGRASMLARDHSVAAQKVLSLPADTPDRESAEAELERLSSTINNLDSTITFDSRRIVCRRIADRFVSWNVLGSDGGAAPLDFDSLYDMPLGTSTLQDIFFAVRNKPLVGKPS